MDSDVMSVDSAASCEIVGQPQEEGGGVHHDQLLGPELLETGNSDISFDSSIKCSLPDNDATKPPEMECETQELTKPFLMSMDEPPVCEAPDEPPVYEAYDEPPVCEASDEPSVCEASDEPPVCEASNEPPMCESYLPILPSTSAQGDMLFKNCTSRGHHATRTIVVPYSICDNHLPKNPIPTPVLDKLKKLGTSVEIDNACAPSPNPVPVVPEPLHHPSTNLVTPTGPIRVRNTLTELVDTVDQTVELFSDLPVKKKKRAPKITPNQVPSTSDLLADIENSQGATKFAFEVDTKHVMAMPDGHKLFTCDICSGVYHRGFSLKRHYLRTHINYVHITKRDLHNCRILLDPFLQKKGGPRKKQLVKEDSPPVVTNLCPPSDIPDLYRCNTCHKCFRLVTELKTHLVEHPPTIAEQQFKRYTCPKCNAGYRRKKMFLRHKEKCETESKHTLVMTNFFCLFCNDSFNTFLQKKQHQIQTHHPKSKRHYCYICKTKVFRERIAVFKHLVSHHPNEFYGCVACKLRFGSKEDINQHNKGVHKHLASVKKVAEQKVAVVQEDPVVEFATEPQKQEIHPNTSNDPNLTYKCTDCDKMFASHLNMTRHRRLAHCVHPRTKKKKKRIMDEKPINLEKAKPKHKPQPLISPRVYQPLSPTDPEVIFYNTISQNIKENLIHHLDGKLDSQEVMEYDLNQSGARNEILNFSASFNSNSMLPAHPEPSTSKGIIDSKEPTMLISPKGQWEKFNFLKNYDGRCGLASYIRDMSHLDISTQLKIRRELQHLHLTPGQETDKESPVNIPAGLLLVERPSPDCAETYGDPDDSKDKGGSGEKVALSGEWVRPRTYVCAVCGNKSPSLWDMEDHKFELHANVWIPHIEIVGEQSSTWDWFYHRRLPPNTQVTVTTPHPPESVPACTKCNRLSASIPDFHRHMLECGGDTTWMVTMLGTASPGARRRKWRPFGCRRRKQTGRRGLKRNIPNTSAKNKHGRLRTKPGDTDTIQNMIANLPVKRVRRVLGDKADIKTRSKATISSVPNSPAATHSSVARSATSVTRSTNKKSAKQGKNNAKGTKKKQQAVDQSEEQTIKKIKLECVDEVKAVVKTESADDSLPLEAEITVQPSDILTSLQMIRVVRPTPLVEEEKPDKADVPIETSKIIEAMREAMLDTEQPTEPIPKDSEKKKKNKKFKAEETTKSEIKCEDKTKLTELNKSKGVEHDVIICHGCGMQFDNKSACQRHKKKCVYWKEEDTKNKCTHCGNVFPYLMALLQHNCSKVEEPPMPELCPVKPVEETLNDSADDIPILSPVDVARDDKTARRLLLLEETIREVGDISFDLSGYMNKFHKCHNEDLNSLSKIKKGDSTTDSQIILNTSENVEGSGGNKSIIEEVSLPESNEMLNEDSNKSGIIPVEGDLPSNSKQIQINNSVSDMFKEIKKPGRRCHKNNIKMSPKATTNKLNFQHMNNDVVVKQKKKRSSNFVMLMKEWEKLEKEGAVGVGKRKRLLTRSGLNMSKFRSCRSHRFYNSSDYLEAESVFIDSSSLCKDFSPATRRSTRTVSVGSLCELTAPENQKPHTTNHAAKNETKIVNSTPKVKEELLEVNNESTEMPAVKKRGRPPAPRLTKETEEHILQTIDSIVQGSTINGESKLINVKCEFNGLTDGPTKQRCLTDLISSSKMSTEDYENTITGFTNYGLEAPSQTLCNGLTSVKKESDTIASLNNIEMIGKCKRKRNKKNLSDIDLNVVEGLSTLQINNEIINRDVLYSPRNIEMSERNMIGNIIESHKINNEHHSTDDSSNSNRKRAQSFESFSDLSYKVNSAKKIKTKQSSIADYLSDLQSKANYEVQGELNQHNSSQDIVNPCSILDGQICLNEEKLPPFNNCVKRKSAHKKHKIRILCKALSQSRSSYKEDITLNAIHEKVTARKKKLNLMKLVKNKHLEIVDNKLVKIKTNNKIGSKEKCQKRVKCSRGVSRNNWEVSIIENKNATVEMLCDKDTQSYQSLITLPSNEPVKQFYCVACDQKFDSAYHLYEHQQMPSHKLKISSSGDQQNNSLDDNDPVKYCKSIGNIINDLEKKSLNVTEVMHHVVKQNDTTDETNAVSGDVGELKSQEEGSQQEWSGQLEWSSRSTTPLWEGTNQSWEMDSFSNGSIGTIMDTVNKLLSSDQELVAAPTVSGYSWADLQLAMGASDEEMAMLEQLGEHSLQDEYVYDNSRPLGAWSQQEENPTLTDLDPPRAHTPLEVKKQETLSDSEEAKSCRGNIGRPRRMLGDYENKEMVCPTCNKHYLGLPALQTHVAWSHCTGVANSSRLVVSGLKRRALLGGAEVDRRLVCFVCQEIVPSAALLEAHIQVQHTKRQPDQDPPKQPISETAEKLKSNMSSALGCLVDKAIDKLLGSKVHVLPSQSEVNSGALQLLGKICAARKRMGNENIKLSTNLLQLLSRLGQASQKEEGRGQSATDLRTVLGRGKPIGVSKGALQASVSSSNTAELKPTNLLDHLAVCSPDVQERPYACPICGFRFLIPSTRNRHMARAHGQYGRRYYDEAEDASSQEELDSGWKDALDLSTEANDNGVMIPSCLDCGLSYPSIQEVIQHRIIDHPRRYSADDAQEDNKLMLLPSLIPIESNSEPTHGCLKNEHVSKCSFPIDNVDSTGVVKKKRGRPPKSAASKTGKNIQLLQLCKKQIVSDGCVEKNELETAYSTKDRDIMEECDSIVSTNRFEKTNDGLSSQHSSEENLAELSKRLDRRKVKGGKLAEEDVRVKAEAALRELNLSRKSKSPSSAAKWGINAIKFTKQLTTGSTTVNGSSPSKPRFASLSDKKWKSSSTSLLQAAALKEELLEDVMQDVYDFKDEDTKPLSHQSADFHKNPLQCDGNKNTSSFGCPSPKASCSTKLNLGDS